MSKVITLTNRIKGIIALGSWPEVFWVAALLVSNTGVKNAEAPGNINSIRKNPGHPMGPNNVLLPLVPDFDESISRRNGSSIPVPTRVRDFYIYLCPETGLEFNREKLREKLGRYNLRLHKLVRLICATLSAEPTARGQLYFIT